MAQRECVAILRDPRHHRQMAGLVPWLSFSQMLETTAAWREAHAPALDWHFEFSILMHFFVLNPGQIKKRHTEKQTEEHLP